MADEPQWRPGTPPWLRQDQPAETPAETPTEPNWRPGTPPWITKPAEEEKPSQHALARAARAAGETFMGGARAAAKPFEPLYHWATGDEEAMKRDREAARNPLTSLKETGAALLSPLTMTVGTVAAVPTSVLASGMGEVSRAGQRAIKAGAEYLSPELGKKVPQPQTSEEAYEKALPGAELAMMAVGARPGVGGVPTPRMPTTTTTTRTVPGVGAEAEAGRFLESQAKDPAAFRQKLQQPPEEIAGPGDKPTTFEHTGELGQQTRAAARRPGQVEEHQARRTEQTQAQLKALEDLQPGGTPADVSAHLRRVMEAENAQADSALQAAQQLGEMEVQAARQRGAQAVEELGGTYDPTTYGNIKRRSLEDAHEVTRAYERELWGRIDPNLPANPQPLQEVERSIYGVMREGGAEEASLSPVERQLTKVIQDMPPQGVPFNELKVLRSSISAELRKELVTNGQTPAYARLSRLRAGIEGAIADSVPPEVYAQVREATQATAQRAQTFRAPGVKEVLRREGTQGPYRIGEAMVPEQFIRTGPGGYDRASNYLRAVPTGLEEFADAVAAKARRTAINPDGTVNPTKLQTFLRQHQEVLRAIDERDGGLFSQRLRNLGATQESIEAAEASSAAGVEAAEANRAAITKKYKDDMFKNLIGVDNDADASRMVGEMFGKNDSVMRAQELRRRLTTPEVREGARAAVTRYIRERFLTMASVNDDPVFRSQAFQKWVANNKPALSIIMDPAQVQRLEKIATSLQRSARLNQTKAVGGGSDTYQMQQAGKAEKGAVREIASKLVPTAFEYLVHVAAHALGGLPGLAASVAGRGMIASRLAKRAAAKAATEEERIKFVQGLIDDAILNPEKARELLGKTTTTETTSKTRTPQARGMSAYEAGVHTNDREDRGKTLRLSFQAGGGVPAIGGTGGRSPGATTPAQARAHRAGPSQALSDGGEARDVQANTQPLGLRERHAAMLAGTPASGPAFERLATRKNAPTAPSREDIRRTLLQFGITGEEAGGFAERQLGERPADSRADGGTVQQKLPVGLTQADVDQALHGPGWEKIRGSPENVAAQRYPDMPRVNPERWDAAVASWPRSKNIEDRRSTAQARQQGGTVNAQLPDALLAQTLRYVAAQLAGEENLHEPEDPHDAVIRDAGGYRHGQGEGGSDEGRLPRAFQDGGEVDEPAEAEAAREAAALRTQRGARPREFSRPGRQEGATTEFLSSALPIWMRAAAEKPAHELEAAKAAGSWAAGLPERLVKSMSGVYGTGEYDPSAAVEAGQLALLHRMPVKAAPGEVILGAGRGRRMPPRPPAEELPPPPRSHNLPPGEEPLPFEPPQRRVSSLGLRDMPLDKAIEQARTEQHLIPSRVKEGYVGAPNWVKTPEDLAKLRADFDAQVERGLLGAKWYEEAQGGIKEMAGEDPRRQHQLSQQLAATSAQANPDTNLGFTLQGHNAIVAGKPLSIVRTGAQAEKLQEGARTGEIPLGRKTGIYARHMDPTMENPSTGTNDIWHARALGYENPEGGLGAAQHAFMDAETVLAVHRANEKKLGGRSDWTPGEIQAAPWVAGKAEGLQEQFGWSPERALAEAVKTYPQYFSKYTAYGTHETTPGVGVGHLPRVATGSEAEREAFAARPESTWRDPITNQDIMYRGVGMYARPSTKATGIFEGPAGLEINPADVARPMVSFKGKAGSREMAPAERAMMTGAEAARAYIDAQNAGAWSVPIYNQKVGESRAVHIPRPGGGPLPLGDVKTLMEIGGRHGLPAVIDYGEGTALTSFGGEGAATGKQVAAGLRGGLGQELRSAFPGTQPGPVKLDTGYVDYSGRWEGGEGTGAVTRELRHHLTNPEAPAMIERLDADPSIRMAVADRIARDLQIAERTGQPIRQDLMRARQIIVEDGFAGLFAALARGAALPAAAVVPVLELLRQQGGRQGG